MLRVCTERLFLVYYQRGNTVGFKLHVPKLAADLDLGLHALFVGIHENGNPFPVGILDKNTLNLKGPRRICGHFNIKAAIHRNGINSGERRYVRRNVAESTILTAIA